MELEDARAVVTQLVDDWLNTRHVAAKAARDASALEKIIGGYVEMFPELKPLAEAVAYCDDNGRLYEIGTSESAPRGAEAVRRVLQEQPNYWWYISELVEALKKRGWLPESDNPANAVRTACERLLSSEGSDVHKAQGMPTKKIAYSYRPDDEPWNGEITYFNDAPSYDPDEEPF
jgi:hypothetical protein